jgi:hypothetical protein
MFFPCSSLTDKILIFFHANAEDAGLNDDFVHSMKETLRVIPPNFNSLKSTLIDAYNFSRVPWLWGIQR